MTTKVHNRKKISCSTFRINKSVDSCYVENTLGFYYSSWLLPFTWTDTPKPVQLLKTYLDNSHGLVSCMLYCLHLVVCERSMLCSMCSMLCCVIRIPNVFFLHLNNLIACNGFLHEKYQERAYAVIYSSNNTRNTTKQRLGWINQLLRNDLISLNIKNNK